MCGVRCVFLLLKDVLSTIHLAQYTYSLICNECLGLAFFFIFFVAYLLSVPLPPTSPILIVLFSLYYFFHFLEQSKFQKLYDTLDPDGSGVLTYVKFQTAFGEEISSGASSIRLACF